MTTRLDIRTAIKAGIGAPAQLSDADLNTIIEEVHFEIVDEHVWPSQRRDEIVSTTADRTGSDAGFTLGSTTVTSVSGPAVGDDPEKYLRRTGDNDFWRIASTSAGVSWTIESAWPKATSPSQNWTLFDRFYSPPGDPNTALREIFQVIDGDEFLEERSLDWLNRRDPNRTNTGDPIVWVSSPAGVISEQQHFELWPRSITARPLRVWWKEEPIMSTDGSTAQYPYRLAVLRGSMRACQYMHGRTNGQGWLQLYATYASEYPAVLEAAKRAADRIRGKSENVNEVRSQQVDGSITDFGINRGIVR